MVSTRSATKQTRLEDAINQKPKPSKTSSSQSKKRKASGTASPPPKRAKSSKTSFSGEARRLNRARGATSVKVKKPSKEEESKDKYPADKNQQTHISTENGSLTEPTKPVIINRAPVLALWGASVAHFLYPSLERSTCTSIGSAISSLCAVSKGRSIGTIEPKDSDSTKKKKSGKQTKDQDEVDVMHFSLPLKNGKAVISGRNSNQGEGYLKGKFKDRYDEVREVFERHLKTWKGEEDELNKKAFHMYEKFRPDVSPGTRGWGRAGELSLDTVVNVVGH